MKVMRVPLDSLHLDPSNARMHGPENLDAIVGSLKRFGQAEPLVIQAGTGRIIGGNGRYVAMKKLGWTEAAVVEVEVDDLTATALGIALNRTAELAEWNPETLSRLLDELRSENALEGVGFDEQEIDRLLAEVGHGGGDVDDPGPEEPPATPVSRPGDLWILGNHRLLCGDSTKAEDVARAMAGEKAALCATDPPYLVDYDGLRPGDSGKDWSGVYREIDIKDADGFFTSVFTNILTVLDAHAAIYCWHADKRVGSILAVWARLGILHHQTLQWIKPSSVLGHCFWHYRHEPCLMGWRQGSKPEHDGRHDHDSVWEVDWDGKARFTGEHPTTKPTELFERPMLKHTHGGAVVFEPFSGSGSQLIAAEKLGRCCRAIEIQPAFVDVAVRRWERATGNAAVLDGTDDSFDVVAEARENAAPHPA